MKMGIQRLIFLIAVCSIMATALATEPSPLEVFPAAKEGMLRFVIVLPLKTRDEENDFKVEIISGKNMLTDGVNLVRLGTTIKAQPLKGWGYLL